jgi:hypothetical protein
MVVVTICFLVDLLVVIVVTYLIVSIIVLLVLTQVELNSYCLYLQVRYLSGQRTDRHAPADWETGGEQTSYQEPHINEKNNYMRHHLILSKIEKTTQETASHWP